MTPTEAPQDLIVLAADLSMQLALEEVLKRYQSLGIRKISYKVIQHPAHDSGVLQHGHELLQAQNRRYRQALAICDRHGCGNERLSREQLEALIENRMFKHWGNRAAAIVIDPELENWLWTDSPHVATEIGWRSGMHGLREWLRNEGLLTESRSKPSDPKAALEKVLRFTRRQRSSALYQTLASKVSLEKCVDPAFLKLRATLRYWFPVTDATT